MYGASGARQAFAPAGQPITSMYRAAPAGGPSITPSNTGDTRSRDAPELVQGAGGLHGILKHQKERPPKAPSKGEQRVRKKSAFTAPPPSVYAALPRTEMTDFVLALKQKDADRYWFLRDLFKLRKQFQRLQAECTSTPASVRDLAPATPEEEETGLIGRARAQTEEALSKMTGSVTMDDAFLYDWMNRVEELKEEFKSVDEEFDEDWSPQRQTQHHAKKLKQMCRLHAYWGSITPEMLAPIIRTLGESSGRFMRCLSVLMAHECTESYPHVFKRISARMLQFPHLGLRFAPGYFQQCNDCGDEDPGEGEEEERFWQDLAPTGGERPAFWQFWASQQKREVSFYWAGVKGMLTTIATENMAVLAKVPYTGGIFHSPMGLAMLEYNWRRVRWAYTFDRVLEVTNIVLLMYMANRVVDKQLPLPGRVICVLIINLYGCFNEVIGIAMRIKCLKGYGVWMLFPGPLTVLTLLLQCYQVYCNVLLLSSTMGTDFDSNRDMKAVLATTFFRTEPMVFSLMIIATWLQFMVNLLAWKPIGLTVLPAARAIISSESIRFLMYQMMFVFMATHAYYALPLNDDGFEMDDAKRLNRGWISFLRMFRMTILGDFDYWELEGVDPRLDDNVIDESEKDWNVAAPNMHRDLRLLVTVFIFVCCVVFMNMYIGVLGHKYDDYKEQVDLIYAAAKSDCVSRYLFRGELWRLACPWTKCLWPDPLEGEDEESDADEQLAHIKLVAGDKMDENFVNNIEPHIDDCHGIWVVVPDKKAVTESVDVQETTKLEIWEVHRKINLMMAKLDIPDE